MYDNTVFVSYANAVFTEIRNTPLESLNTPSFRSGLLEALEAAESSTDDSGSHSHELRPIVESYNVHFLPLDPVSLRSTQASVYTFDGFPGLYLVRDFFTKEQCDALLLETLVDYINPPNNSNLYQNDPNVATPFWPSPVFSKLRWATIGHMYDWGTRTYKGYTKFPGLLVDVTRDLLSHFNEDYIPDAAIINFYSKAYFLRLHKDDAEETDDSVLNISLGAPAIFMLGGTDHSTIPVSFVVESGSVVLMADKSRFCLHGIVKLLSYNKPGYQPSGGLPINLHDPLYGRPQLLKLIPQCGAHVFSNIVRDTAAITRIREISNDLRVSISIRRAKR
ncbi:hypothetical protein BBOV_I002590 [Babesia bovis T2Bo]|uniref:hypothetical protein n=1 Tax=Babesia bovis T2Bo TaxID=484906 RepID=UPI001C361D87|nr:hypothetical protein BBOV_I002590 [Babesia bovis T2Bo]EDO05341.2 hypothetical protein BBOV_I002590 [Babesia bovis T2Bo]